MSYYLLNNELEKFQKKRVLLRVDWNISFDEKNELNEFKIQASMETIAWLLKQGASLIIVTHWSRPSGFEYKFSTIHLIKILKKYGYDVVFIPTVSLIESYCNNDGRIFLLENIRFLPHEKTCSPLLAQKLRSCVDIFVQDGFGILAKKACLTTVVPSLFKQEDRFIGFLIEKERAVLDEMRKADRSKNVLLIGGAKIPEKLGALQTALSIASKILLMPPLVATYQAALGQNNNGNTIIYKGLFPVVHELIVQAQKQQVEIIIPLDFQIKTDQGLYQFADNTAIQQKDQIVGVGPQTITLYENAMRNASNVFMTGISGFITERKSWYTGSMLFKVIGSKTKRIIAGGDSVALMQSILGLNPYNSTFLTGGSASFTYLGTGNLIGLSPFKKEDISPKS
jgi:3-phosphoglycerate kinase